MAWESHRRHAYVPVAVKRGVYHRAGGVCEARYRGCLLTDRLEYHHVIGVADDPHQKPTVETVALLCHSCHNLETQKQATKGRNAWKLEPEVNPANRR